MISSMFWLVPLLLVLPGVAYLAAITFVSCLPMRRRQTSGTPAKLAIIVPAHNEEVMIGRCIESLQGAAYAGSEIIVVADNCSDATAAIARGRGVTVLERFNTDLRGKGYALVKGFNYALSRGFDGVLVIDGDSRVSPNLIRATAAALGAGQDATQSLYRVDDAESSWRTMLMDLAFLAFNGVRPKARARLGLSCGIFGNGFALSRRILTAIPYGAFSITEDLEYHMQIVAAGCRVHFLEHASVFGFMPQGGETARTQRARWEGGRWLVARTWIPRLFASALRGKLWLAEPLFDMLTIPLGFLAAGSALLLLAPVPEFRVAGATGVGTIALHTIRAALLSEDPLAFMKSLLCAPFYICWKLTTVGAMLTSSARNAEWIRTERTK